MTENKDTIGTSIDDWKNVEENESEFNLLNSDISKKRDF